MAVIEQGQSLGVREEYIWDATEHALSEPRQIGEVVESLWDAYRTKEGSISREIPEWVSSIGIVALSGTVETFDANKISALQINPQWENEQTKSMPLLWLRVGETVADAQENQGKWQSFSLLTHDVFVTKVAV
jgi:hypothetical protein